jgi:hypothetical protein
MRTELLWFITQQVPFSGVRKFLTLENGTDRLSRNLNKKLPLLAA